MRSGFTADALREITTLFESGTITALTDRQLLERFLERRDDGADRAFAALVARHGPMVLGVCRRALTDPVDAEDAFQATFLVLVRKARSVRVDDSLGRWLYGVSRKVAARARVVASRRPRTKSYSLDAIAARSADPDRFETWSILDEELARLPLASRSVVVLCDLGGLTHEEAARDLGCPVGTIKSRLARARARLRITLERRGLAPSTRMIAPTVPTRLAESVMKITAAVSGSSKVGMVPASAVVLAEGMLRTMTLMKLKLTGAVILSIGFAATGAGVMATQDKGEGKTSTQGEARAINPAVEAPELRTEDRLNKRVTLRIQVSSLSEILDALQKETAFTFRLDPTAATKSELSRKGAFRYEVQEVKLSNVLNSLLQPYSLTYHAEGDVILISSTSQADSRSRNQLDSLRSREIKQARDRLKAAERIAREPNDPAILQARVRVEELQTAYKLLQKGLQALGPIPEEPIGKVREAMPEGGPGDKPPKEFTKVSMPDYLVGPPDIIVVEVLEALPGRPITGERLVRPDGKISLGFYGEVAVAGLTPTGIKAKIALHLREFLDDTKLGLLRTNAGTGQVEPVEPARTSRIFVDVASYNSQVYYVQGEVGVPGRLPITGNETVLDAINYAGGLTPMALKTSIRLVRPGKTANDREQSLPVDIDAILERGDSGTNYQILPGDRLIVGRVPVTTPPADLEARMQNLERKLEEILKVLERLPKSAGNP